MKLRLKQCPTANSIFAIGWVSCSADGFVVTRSSVLRMNICALKPAHRPPQKNVIGYFTKQPKTATK